MTRRFLFLQGPASPFFSRLADCLAARGERVDRINFCAGDALYWRGKPARRFPLPAHELARFVEAHCRDHRITDVLLFGDQRPVHRAVMVALHGERVRFHVFEEGYIRPNCITLARGGLGGEFILLRDPEWLLRASAAIPEPVDGAPLPRPFARRALHDMVYHAANLLNPIAYPGYRTHRPHLSAIEYAGWARRYSRFPWWRRRDAALVGELIERRTAYFLFPLQLNGDAQVTHRSQFRDMRAAIEAVVRSFAAHAPQDSALLIKNHPLDTGLMDYASCIRSLGRETGVLERIRYIETGDLASILRHVRGVVTVNSTVGMAALAHSRPIKVLGEAIFDIPGLANQCELDEFWVRPEPPHDPLYKALCNVLRFTTQVHGDFYTSTGMKAAISGCAPLLERDSRLEQLLARVPIGRRLCERPRPS